jgi:nitric oxide reductase NorQ protein
MSGIYYQPLGNEVEIFRQAYDLRLPLLIKGPTGCGKSRFVEAMAHEKNQPLVHVSCNEDTSASDLMGRYLIKGGDTVWIDGPVTRAVRSGAILYLDEIAEAREDVIVVLHSLTDHRREIYLDRTNESLTAPASFMLIASFNPGYQSRLKELKPSTRHRFVTLAFGYPEKNIEAQIVAKETGLDLKMSEKLVDLAYKIRSLTELGLRETVSTRLLVYTAQLMKAGLHPRLAGEAGMVQVLTDEPEATQALLDLVNLHF